MNTDTLHPKGPHEDWNESFYFNYYDKTNHICSFMRIGLTPNKQSKNMFVFLLMPNLKLGMRAEEPYNDHDTKTPLSLQINDLCFEKIQDEDEWSLSYDGPMINPHNPQAGPPVFISFKLNYKAAHPIFNYRDCPITKHQKQLSEKVASEHLEQYGRIKGTLSINDTTFQIDALGERDHSWGIRDWTAPKQWIWLTGQFNEKTAFNLTKLTTEQGDIDAGFLHLDNTTHPIKTAEIHTNFTEANEPKDFKLTLTTTDEKTHHIQALMLDHIKVPFTNPATQEHSIMYENLARYSYNEHTGYGIAEYLIKQDKKTD